MGGYSGNQANAAQNSAWPYLGVGFVVLVALAILGIAGVAYFSVFTEIRTRSAPAIQQTFAEAAFPSAKNSSGQSTPDAFESVAKTLTPDERKVIDVLSVHKGRYLQKYIRNETGLSRLQTHRIVARLAERGIVTLEKTGNTNQVCLADWLQKQA